MYPNKYTQQPLVSSNVHFGVVALAGFNCHGWCTEKACWHSGGDGKKSAVGPLKPLLGACKPADHAWLYLLSVPQKSS